ncbi:MAG: peroxidase-related enzyme [Desertimonas sp.]
MRDDREVSWYPVPDDDDLPEDLAKLFAKAAANLGFVPNVFRAFAYRPDHFRAWFSHYKQLHVPSEHLDAVDREMIAVVVSMTNGCLYCLVAHGQALRQAMGDPVAAERITLDWRRAGLDVRRQAICEYAEKITVAPQETTTDDIDHLMSLGLSREEVWDVAEIAAMYNFTNRMAMATGQMPNREYHALDR